MLSAAREGARVGGARNWSNVVLDFTGIAGPTLLGPFEIPCDAIMVQQGASNNLFILEEPVSTDEVAAKGTEYLFDLGLPLSTAGAFFPARFERFWVLSAAALGSLTVLTAFWDVHVPATR